MDKRSWKLGQKTAHGVWSAITILLGFSPWTSGEVLRLSKVVTEGSADAERFELKNGDEREVLFVEKQAIVTSADVKSASRSPLQVDALAITLTDEGGKKLADATNDAHGDMRIAIVVNGEVLSAPRVNSKVGKNFEFNGLKEYPGTDLDLLGWQFEGKSDEEIAKLLRELKATEHEPPPPRAQPEYYNDEEYAALKKEREKMGIFYLDQLPGKNELDRIIAEKMTEAQIIHLLGRSSGKTSGEAEGSFSLYYHLAPERRNLTAGMRLDGFHIRFHDEKAVWWGEITTDAPREGKPPKGGRRALISKTPQADMMAENFDFIRWAEEIELSLIDGEENPTTQDLMDLISIIYMVAETAGNDSLIEVNCSVVTMLARGFPEVEELKKSSKDGKIDLPALKALLEPYLFGEKDFPGSEVPQD